MNNADDTSKLQNLAIFGLSGSCLRFSLSDIPDEDTLNKTASQEAAKHGIFHITHFLSSIYRSGTVEFQLGAKNHCGIPLLRPLICLIYLKRSACMYTHNGATMKCSRKVLPFTFQIPRSRLTTGITIISANNEPLKSAANKKSNLLLL